MEGSRLGAVRISPQVLATIARLTALSVPGVLRLHRDLSSGVDRLLRVRGGIEGTQVHVVDDAVTVDLSIVAAADANLYALGRQVQAQVARAITEMVGMPVLSVNVRIADVADELPTT